VRQRWLDDEEMRAWRSFLQASVLVTERLDHELRDAYGVTLPEYEVLVFLSAAPEHRIRMNELAAAVLVTKSRLTHTVDRLVARGWAAREPCPEDRRGTYAVLTDAGLGWLRGAAPLHLEGVRRHFVGHLDRDELAAIGAGLARVVARLGSGPAPPRQAR
jgi:DNA-binding MarR family transcriptional regulator